MPSETATTAAETEVAMARRLSSNRSAPFAAVPNQCSRSGACHCGVSRIP